MNFHRKVQREITQQLLLQYNTVLHLLNTKRHVISFIFQFNIIVHMSLHSAKVLSTAGHT